MCRELTSGELAADSVPLKAESVPERDFKHLRAFLGPNRHRVGDKLAPKWCQTAPSGAKMTHLGRACSPLI